MIVLDVMVQIQILLLLCDLQCEFGMGVIFVIYDIGVVVEILDWIVVMYVGQIIEEGDMYQVINYVCYFYMQGLLVVNLYDVQCGECFDVIFGVLFVLEMKFDVCFFVLCCFYVWVDCCVVLLLVVMLGLCCWVVCVLVCEDIVVE